jgi:hypothetical protein
MLSLRSNTGGNVVLSNGNAVFSTLYIVDNCKRFVEQANRRDIGVRWWRP